MLLVSYSKKALTTWEKPSTIVQDSVTAILMFSEYAV